MQFSIVMLLSDSNNQQTAAVVVALVTLSAISALIVSRCLLRSMAHRHCVLLGSMWLILAMPVFVCMTPTFLAPPVPNLTRLTSYRITSITSERPFATQAVSPSDLSDSTETARNEINSGESNTQLAAQGLNQLDHGPFPDRTIDAFAKSKLTKAQHLRSVVDETSTSLPVSNPSSNLASAPHNTQPTWSSNIASTLCLLWLVGFSLQLTRGFLAHRFWHRVVQLASPWQMPEPINRFLTTKYGFRQLPTVHVTPRVHNAVSGGLISPYVLLNPMLLAELTEEQLQDVLDHELAHQARRDHWVRYLEQFVMAIHWFNPAVRGLCRQLAICREHLCDNYVLKNRNPVAYGETLLRVAELTLENAFRKTSTPCGATSVLADTSELQGRITSILAPTSQRNLTVTKKFAFAVTLVMTLMAWLFSGFSAANTTLPTDPMATTVPQITQEPDAGDSTTAQDQELIRNRLAELRANFADTAQTLAKMNPVHQAYLLEAWASLDLNTALEMEKMLPDSELSIRQELVRRLIASRRWNDVVDIVARCSEKSKDTSIPMRYISSLAYAAAQRNEPEAVQLLQSQLRHYIELFKKSRSESAARYEQRPELAESAASQEQMTLAQIAITEWMNEMTSLRLVQEDELAAARQNQLHQEEDLKKAVVARERILNKAQQVLGNSPRFERFSFFPAHTKNNFAFGNEWIALESWFTFNVAATNNDSQSYKSFPVSVSFYQLRPVQAKPHDLLGTKLAELLPQMNVGWLSEELPALNSTIATPWFDHKLKEGQWEIAVAYLIGSPNQPMERVRLIATAANQLRSQQPEIAAKLRKILLEYWSKNGPKIVLTSELPQDELRAQIEALLETSLTFYKANEPAVGSRFWNMSIEHWTELFGKDSDSNSKKEIYNTLVLASAVALEGKITADQLPQNIQKQLTEWNGHQFLTYTYIYRDVTRELPWRVEPPLFKATQYEEHREFYRLVGESDWPAAAAECQRLASRNTAWKTSYSDLGVASYRESGLAKTLQWAATLTDPELRLAIELGAIREAKRKSANAPANDTQQNYHFILPLIIWPKGAC